MNILLTFTGYHDPYTNGLIGEEEQTGPILSILNNKVFDKVILFATPILKANTLATVREIDKLHPHMSVELIDFNISDPTDYFELLRRLRNSISSIIESFTDANLYVSVASGTPQMHACWLLLVACGELPARILHVRPAKFVSKNRPLLSEIDITSPDFPIIRSNICGMELPEDLPRGINEVIEALGIIGDHPKMQAALEMGAALADSELPVLIIGETGTGKELLARYIHLLSGRPRENFIPINCAAIPHELVESILFGHKKGAFTGAIRDQVGKFDTANEGTLFLDELAELPVTTQAKLLRVLQDSNIEPIGAERAHKVNVRIIAATNQNLKQSIRYGKFREDLYYRINVGEIRLPALRERKTDIPKIALYILDNINKNLRIPKRLTPAALARLQNHSWPGNIRDLENVLERSLRLTKKMVLDAEDLLISEPITFRDPYSALPEPTNGFSIEDYLIGARRQLILRAIELANGNKSEAARLLGITPQAVHKFVKKIENDFNSG